MEACFLTRTTPHGRTHQTAPTMLVDGARRDGAHELPSLTGDRAAERAGGSVLRDPGEGLEGGEAAWRQTQG